MGKGREALIYWGERWECKKSGSGRKKGDITLPDCNCH